MLLIFAFYSCSCFPLDYEKIADKTTDKTAKKLEKQKKLHLVGIGGQMMNDIQMMAMSFQFFQEVDLKTARELAVYAVSEYLTDINSNEVLRPYLHQYPFTAKNVAIRIWIYNPDKSDPPLDKIYFVSAINGTITYYLDLPETYSRKAICKETYEEALKLTQSNTNN